LEVGDPLVGFEVVDDAQVRVVCWFDRVGVADEVLADLGLAERLGRDPEPVDCGVVPRAGI
jgi:hypothetical protein